MSPSDQPTEPPATASTEESGEPAEPAGPGDDVKGKFREALARKQGKEQGVPHHPDQAGPAGRSQDAKTQRMFRRKSG
ncbi:MAG TPA: DUF5302 domain-containing protein [Jiangellaceae bacterium]|jgi:hypothetical protein|nr:DUF5302 domain-containing protein [Jiangellaceae bacterium]